MAEHDAEGGAFDGAGDHFDELTNGRGRESAELLSAAFERAGRSIEDSLTRAARTGELAFEAMAQSILRSLASLAIERFVSGPLTNVLGSALKSAPFFGARAAGGPVAPGGAYLVGERGPELFTPSSAGVVSRPSASPVTVHVHLSPGDSVESIRKSQGQIAKAVARAVARGRKEL